MLLHVIDASDPGFERQLEVTDKVLEEIGERDGLSVPQLLGRLYDELSASGRLDESTNFTSFLRVSCLRYLQLQLAGGIPADPRVPIRSLDPAWVLAAERRPSA